MRLAGFQARSDISGPNASVPESFAQLRNDLANASFLNTLGKLAVDDPTRVDRLTLSNLRENKRARNSLASLNAARSCLFGNRQFGPQKWYADRPGLAARLKTQDQRRKVRLGLVANLAFYNKLNMGDLQALMHTGNPAGLAALSDQSLLTIPTLRSYAALTSPYDILRVLAPERAEALNASLTEIIALADYVQTLCGHLAVNEAVEPAHDVICRILRSGADFQHALNFNPIDLATAAISPMCTKPDRDAVLPARRSATRATGRRLTRRSGPGANTTAPRGGRNNTTNYCFDFQVNRCWRRNCVFRHACDVCDSSSHGRDDCTTATATNMNV